MTTKDALDALLAQFKRTLSVPDPVASDTWTFTDRKGRKHTARIEIGKPQSVPHSTRGDWFCPVFIEGWTPHVIPAMGLGSVDALLNAVTLVRGFREHIADLHISIGGTRAKRRRVAAGRRP